MNNYLSRANRINNRLCDVYQECFNELIEVAKENKISKIVFSIHDNIDVPQIVFERENNSNSTFTCSDLQEIVFEESYNYITLIGENDSAYMDRFWGDFFDVAKIGKIYQAVMEIVGNNDLKPIELR